ncbi:MAG: hypothetical protein HQL07_03075 [Nitrospirae bacterium]|nr:hypothetical protein [Magnetococcales bacterium]HAT50432.1 hypothetical protein [Alphaproteobacteria bacterium]
MNVRMQIDQDEAIYHLDILLGMKEQDIEFFQVGKFMAMIQDNGSFHGEDFFRWVSEKYGFESRKANYIIWFYKAAKKSGISFSQLMGNKIGWTKLTLLAPVINPSNLNDWLDLARIISVEKLKIEVKNAKKAKAA